MGISTLLISIFSWIGRKPTVSTARTDSTQLSFPANPGCEEAAQLRSCPAACAAHCCFFRGDSANHLYAERAAESLFPLPLDVVSPVRGLQSTLTTVCMVAQGSKQK